MFAMVARTGSIRRSIASGGFAVRVTHALLFLAATTVSPGVRDACASCPETGRPDMCCGGCHAPATHSTCADAAVAATHCCGSQTHADPCAQSAGIPSASRVPPSGVADAGDGGQNTTGGCRCELEPRDAATAAIVINAAAKPRSGGHAAALPAFLVPRATAAAPADRMIVAAAADIPARPLRVLYGVWRN
jgi:hypothetical protein